MGILSIEEILAMLAEQARLRAPENDEAGVLLHARELIQERVQEL